MFSLTKEIEKRIYEQLKSIEDFEIKKRHLDFALKSGLIIESEYNNVLSAFTQQTFSRKEVFNLFTRYLISVDETPPRLKLMELGFTSLESEQIRQAVIDATGD